MWKVIVTLIVIGIIASAMPISAENVYEAWVERYGRPSGLDDYPNAICVDDSGYVYVAGFIRDSTTLFDFITIKYLPDGDTAWVRQYGGPGFSSDAIRALAVDHEGNVFVTGSSWTGTSHDMVTIKYSSSGDALWIRNYDGPASQSDGAMALAIDQDGNVYVAGGSQGIGSNDDFLTIKYDSNGDTLWVRRFNGPGNDADVPWDIKVDGNGYVYVTGFSHGGGIVYTDYATIKYSPNGDELWVRRYSGPFATDEASSIAIDDSGNVYVTGYTQSTVWGAGSYYDYLTIKYSPLGDTVWARKYNYPGDSADYAHKIAIDDSGGVYVTGNTATVKYSSDGNVLWTILHGGHTLGLDGGGNVYLIGETWDDFVTYSDFVTMKFSSAGDSLWQIGYNGPGSYVDGTRAVAVDKTGNVYVAGSSANIQNYDHADLDITTIKYSTCTSSSPKAGDANADGKYTLSDVLSAFNYIFHTPGCSPLPSCWLSERLCRGDWNGDGRISIVDVVQGVNYVFNKPIGGPWNPVPSVGCCP